MNEKQIWSDTVLKAIDENRQKREELVDSKIFYEKLYKSLYR